MNNNLDGIIIATMGLVTGTWAAIVATCVASERQAKKMASQLIKDNFFKANLARVAYDSAHPRPDNKISKEFIEWAQDRKRAVHAEVVSHIMHEGILPEPIHQFGAAFKKLPSVAKILVTAVVMGAGLMPVLLAGGWLRSKSGQSVGHIGQDKKIYEIHMNNTDDIKTIDNSFIDKEKLRRNLLMDKIKAPGH